jgi:Neutral/alkaline non-lysosomal ceramidase, N-terminal
MTNLAKQWGAVGVFLNRCWIVACVIAVANAVLIRPAAADEVLWKAGAAKAVITPKEALWMAGYATRTSPASGTLHPLYVRALALEETSGHRVVLVSTDVLGIPRSISENVSHTLADKFGLPRDAVMLNASHTHCGPVLRAALYDAYPIGDAEKQKIQAYSRELESAIVHVVGDALAHLVPARVAIGQGMTDFAVNRRTNREPDVPALIAKHELRGPTDHSVPVLSVRHSDGKLLAAVFGYACHNTTLSIQQWNGDYAGFAETNLEQAHPGAIALFFMGCGADQNPIPRRKVELAHKYGRMMSDAVEAVLSGKMETIVPKLRTHYELVTLHLGAVPTRAELAARAHDRSSAAADVSLSDRSLATGGQAALDCARGRSRGRLRPAIQGPLRSRHLGQQLRQRRNGLHPLGPRAQGGGLRRQHLNDGLRHAGRTLGNRRGRDRRRRRRPRRPRGRSCQIGIFCRVGR